MAFFQDFPDLENAIIKFQDFPGFPGPVRTLITDLLTSSASMYSTSNVGLYQHHMVLTVYQMFLAHG